MPEVHCFTSVSLNYLHRARILADSLKEQHPDWTLWLCLADKAPPGFSIEAEMRGFDRLIRLEDLGIPDLERWCFKHNVIELCTAVKGYALNHILATGADLVIYLDPDIAVFAPLDPVLTELQTSSIVMTPHLLTPEARKRDVWDMERSALRHGVYNLGFLGVKNDEIGRAFATWWQTRLAWFCFEMASEGIYTDQRWCDLIPVFFEKVGILRDPGLNVASWNLRHRHVEFDHAGRILVNGVPLRFFHFTKVDHVGEREILRHIERSVAVLHILKWYRAALTSNAVEGLPRDWWHYGTYSDGTKIAYGHREVFRTHLDVQEAFPHPFSAGTYDLWIAENQGQVGPYLPALAFE